MFSAPGNSQCEVLKLLHHAPVQASIVANKLSVRAICIWRCCVQAAEQCRAIGDDTLVALEGQGRQLHRMQDEYDQVDEYADNAESNLKWLARCCWCCNCFRDQPKPKGGWGKKNFKRKAPPAQPHPRAAAREGVRSCLRQHQR